MLLKPKKLLLMRGNSWLQAGNPTSSGGFAYKAIKTKGNTKGQLLSMLL